jgi:hypothetical protein
MRWFRHISSTAVLTNIDVSDLNSISDRHRNWYHGVAVSDFRSNTKGVHMKTVAFFGFVAAGAVAFGSAQGAVLFQDSLQQALDQWTPSASGSATIAPAPGGGQALTFGTPWAYGDIFTKDTFESSTGSFTVTFDFEAVNFSSTGSGAGVFLGAPGATGVPVPYGWLISDTPYYGIPNVPDATTWQRVTYTFGGTSTYLMLEMWNGAQYASSGNVFFRNVSLTDNADGVAIGTFGVTPVPEPGSFSLLVAGLAMIGCSGVSKNVLRSRLNRRHWAASATITKS